MDDCIEIIEDAFYQVLRDDSELRLVADGFRFTEGPAWWAAAGCLVFSDIPDDTIYQWTEAEGLSIWRRPSRHANGNTTDRDGNLLTCEHGSRTVTRTSPDGQVTTVASTYRGCRLNSPNDIVVKSDGAIWFTDPPYGIKPEQSEQPANYVFRLDPGAVEPVVVASDFSRPNGLCFSSDERLLYIADSDTKIHHVRRFTVGPDNTLSGGEVFAVIEPGVPDGMRVDEAGRLWTTAADGVQVFAPDGRMLGKIHTPQTCANCAFGGPDGDTLFMTATSSVWSIRLATRGLMC
ncbi:MAG: SMP-30/gluconolactonase/LRE family protein [Planctomycetes bacterium]|nr:SMP-30/gluconolactonase/LRE family protein [Planctomycetota bacterium]